jgi:hypothetical protein
VRPVSTDFSHVTIPSRVSAASNVSANRGINRLKTVRPHSASVPALSSSFFWANQSCDTCLPAGPHWSHGRVASHIWCW